MYVWGLPRPVVHAHSAVTEHLPLKFYSICYPEKLANCRPVLQDWLRFIVALVRINPARSLLVSVLLGFTLCIGFVSLRPYDPFAHSVETVVLEHAVSSLGAVCLDGSAPVYHMARGSNSRKWIVFHEGGDWCSQLMQVDDPTVQRDSWSCHARSKTGLGSSKKTSWFDFDAAAAKFTYLSRDPTLNPLMHDWNHVYLPYCDGASFSGARVNPAFVEGSNVYLRGRHVLQAIINSLVTSGLERSTDVVIAGASAGGLAVFLHADTWTEAVLAASAGIGRTDPPYIVALSDGGMFPELQVLEQPCKYVDRMKTTWMYHNLTNNTSPTVDRCVKTKHYANKPWKCMFASNLAPFVNTPIFVTASAFDGWQIEYELCHINSLRSIDEFGDRMRTEVVSVLAKQTNGAFIDACRHHTRCFSDIEIDGDTAATAFKKWYLKWIYQQDSDPQRVWIQKGKYLNMQLECAKWNNPPTCQVGRMFGKKQDNIVRHPSQVYRVEEGEADTILT
mmetsp:Transcript_26402/g.50144  ORF Transcript_26402/g.50144 Transcript_26402/m.50144 type:complete len:504 (+) Transcript_26402:151-1662(+)|eukprot:CAMPEP_0114234238 /NCGR_PEP_ID=MMETSP0058-20121206/5605_1 /TAXON_ID=36894 /ORGANISM="Pyramimonas parkeae, CCMP726" /LENGTH=503 /DNA_ID=CAMNT_0001345909 /DNA_START=139 /DNA_END=1650 /DNA_ORIENTATION=-